MSEGKQRREFFRVVYPKEVRPLCKTKKFEFKVIDISEGGVRLTIEQAESILKVGLVFDATIVFLDQSQVAISGKILRVEKEAFVVRTTKGIPLQKIMAEQRDLIAKYGTLYERV